MENIFYMPTNLNALIRYQTIDRCLKGGRRRWLIADLIEKCSESLGETRGRYKPVSERTIRDDIRVMRSDILGFNAPIVQENGKYFYSDPGYSIYGSGIVNPDLAERILSFLVGLRKQVRNSELEAIIDLLSKQTGKEFDKQVSLESIPEFDQTDSNISAINKNVVLSKHAGFQIRFKLKRKSISLPHEVSEMGYSYFQRKIDWGEIFDLINRIVVKCAGTQ